MNNPKRIKSKRKAYRLERNRMIREPDRNFDPPEDEPEDDEDREARKRLSEGNFTFYPNDEPELTRVPCDGVGDNDGFFEFEPEDRDCKYWENLN